MFTLPYYSIDVSMRHYSMLYFDSVKTYLNVTHLLKKKLISHYLVNLSEGHNFLFP